MEPFCCINLFDFFKWTIELVVIPTTIFYIGVKYKKADTLRIISINIINALEKEIDSLGMKKLINEKITTEELEKRILSIGVILDKYNTIYSELFNIEFSSNTIKKIEEENITLTSENKIKLLAAIQIELEELIKKLIKSALKF